MATFIGSSFILRAEEALIAYIRMLPCGCYILCPTLKTFFTLNIYFTENMATGMWPTHPKCNMGMQWDQSDHWGVEYRPQPYFAIPLPTQPLPPARSHFMDDLAQHVVVLMCYFVSKRCWLEPTAMTRRNVQLLDQVCVTKVGGKTIGQTSIQFAAVREKDL
jgi:hypothetical protein